MRGNWGKKAEIERKKKGAELRSGPAHPCPPIHFYGQKFGLAPPTGSPAYLAVSQRQPIDARRSLGLPEEVVQ